MSSPYPADVELARQCAAGDEEAWERFILEYRPLLYRAADRIDPSGNARDLADSLFADLYGIRTGVAGRKSLFHYFQGRSSLVTWLRAVLAQRFVDRVRAERRLQPLPDEERAVVYPGRYSTHSRGYAAPAESAPAPDRERDLRLMQHMLTRALASLHPRDRLRLACYYAQGLTLAETGRVLREHEATVSRQLARTRRAIRTNVERWLRDEARMNDAQVARCFASISEDVGPIDLDRILAVASERKEPATGRSR